MDAFVLETEEQRPQWVVHGDRRVAVGEAGMGVDQLEEPGVTEAKVINLVSAAAASLYLE